MKAIALCGGGSKGVYELGAWEAFRELDVTFDIVTGTSIGALNGAMLAQGEFDKCAELWNTVTINDIVLNGFDVEDFNIRSLIKHNDFKPFLKQVLREKGNHINPFRELLGQYIDFEKIQNSKVKLGVTLTTFPKIKLEEVLLNELNGEEIYNNLLATSSCFPVFPVCRFNNKQYIDGGYSDNLPINFSLKLGATEVYAIDLNTNITHKDYVGKPFIHYIYPKWDLGSFLYFDRAHLSKNRMLGYLDVMKYFDKFDGFKYTFNKCKRRKKNSKIALIILNDHAYFKYNKMKTFVKKPDYIDVFSYLNRHIQGKISDYDYYLKCIEELAIVYELDYIKIYNVNDMIKELLQEVNKNENEVDIIEELSKLPIAKKKDYINNYDIKKFIYYLYNTEFNFELKMTLLQVNVELYLIYVLIEGIKQ